MKIFFILCALFSANAFASEKAADLYQILKDAGVPEMGAGVFHIDQERVKEIYCQLDQETSVHKCSFDRTNENRDLLRVTGDVGKKMFELLAPAGLACNQGLCGFSVDMIQCEYYVYNSTPMSTRTNCRVTRTNEL